MHYPVFLDLTGRPCFVIGGCGMAEEKVQGLLRSNARVTVIAPDLTRSSTSWPLKAGSTGSPADIAGGTCGARSW